MKCNDCMCWAISFKLCENYHKNECKSPDFKYFVKKYHKIKTDDKWIKQCINCPHIAETRTNNEDIVEFVYCKYDKNEAIFYPEYRPEECPHKKEGSINGR